MKAPKIILLAAVAVVTLISLSSVVHFFRVDPTQYVFSYTAGTSDPVNEQNNPMLPVGFNFAFGPNARQFRVTKEVIRHTFNANEKDPASPFNEAMTWDSKEGVTMQADWSLSARVVDPYAFFKNFGESQYNYDRMEKFTADLRIYECLRQMGLHAARLANEINSTMMADSIQRDPSLMRVTMLDGIKEGAEGIRSYAKRFGVEVLDIEFPGRFSFPDGDAIEAGRGLLTQVETELRGKELELETARAEAQQAKTTAEIAAAELIGEAKKKAAARQSETAQLVNSLTDSITRIGPDGTFRLEMSNMQRQLVEKGVFPEVILTSKSVFAAPYYPVEKK